MAGGAGARKSPFRRQGVSHSGRGGGRVQDRSRLMPKRTANLIQVVKASGEREPFSKEKVLISLRRAGVGRELAEDVLTIVESELYEGIPTREIYRHIFQHLRGSGGGDIRNIDTTDRLDISFARGHT